MKTVAVAEDEPITRMDICAMLEDLGFSVTGEASDGFDAIELCRRTRPDVILMDVKMPIFDGLAAAETICREDLAGCVVMLTAFSDEEIVARAAKAGVTGYLVKPIDRSKLLPTIEVAYAQSCRLRESRQAAEEARRSSNPNSQIYKKLGLIDRPDGALGIMTITPSEAAIIGADAATKAANVDIVFVDRFSGSLV